MGPTSSRPDVRGKSGDEAVEMMVEWFRDNFEDPAHNTPYDGGYVYIWGGPYEAAEEISEAFDGAASEAAIAAAIEEIEHDGFEWAPATSRLVPEEPSDPAVCAKLRLYHRIEHWGLDADDGSDPATSELPFNIAT
jgi:hypothetical protein